MIEFNTYLIDPRFDPNGGYWLRIRQKQPKTDMSVYKEAIESCSLNINPKTAAFLFDAVLSTAMGKVATDGVPRKLGDLIKLEPVARGKLKGPYSAYNPETCSCVVSISALKGLEKKMDLTAVRLVNARPGLQVAFTTMMTAGGAKDGTVVRGRTINVLGRNIQFDAALGDSAEVAWIEDGETKTAQLTPKQADECCHAYDWPTALNDVEPGTELTFRFKTRAGIPDAETQVNEVVVTLVTAD